MQEFLNRYGEAGISEWVSDAMRFFRRSDITVRCGYRGTTLAVPDHDALLDACEPGQRRRLQSCLAREPIDTPSWLVEWRKSAGDMLRPKDIVAILRCEEVAVELAYGHKGILAEMLVMGGTRVGAGAQLARLERRAKTVAAPEPPTRELLRQFVSRQRRDAALIAALQAELAALRQQRGWDGGITADIKFKQLKTAFSKHYHPDTRPPGDEERGRRERVFQEFWPIIEEIERS